MINQSQGTNDGGVAEELTKLRAERDTLAVHLDEIRTRLSFLENHSHALKLDYDELLLTIDAERKTWAAQRAEALNQRDTLAAQLAEALAALKEVSFWCHVDIRFAQPDDDMDALRSRVKTVNEWLAAPAPRADLMAAAMALAEAELAWYDSCEGEGPLFNAVAKARDVYRAAKETSK